jgi:hypothetical protein
MQTDDPGDLDLPVVDDENDVDLHGVTTGSPDLSSTVNCSAPTNSLSCRLLSRTPVPEQVTPAINIDTNTNSVSAVTDRRMCAALEIDSCGQRAPMTNRAPPTRTPAATSRPHQPPSQSITDTRTVVIDDTVLPTLDQLDLAHAGMRWVPDITAEHRSAGCVHKKARTASQVSHVVGDANTLLFNTSPPAVEQLIQMSGMASLFHGVHYAIAAGSSADIVERILKDAQFQMLATDADSAADSMHRSIDDNGDSSLHCQGELYFDESDACAALDDEICDDVDNAEMHATVSSRQRSTSHTAYADAARPTVALSLLHMQQLINKQMTLKPAPISSTIDLAAVVDVTSASNFYHFQDLEQTDIFQLHQAEAQRWGSESTSSVSVTIASQFHARRAFIGLIYLADSYNKLYRLEDLADPNKYQMTLKKPDESTEGGEGNCVHVVYEADST